MHTCKNDGVYTSFMMMSDEVTTPISKETDGIRIMKANNQLPILSLVYGQVGPSGSSLGRN